VNLAGRTEYAAITEGLRKRMLERIVEAGEAAPIIEPSIFLTLTGITV
jgi:hypothetical protein